MSYLSRPARPRPTPSPSALTLAYLRERGFLAENVEQRIPHSKNLKDLYGWIDILAIMPGGSTVGVQATDHTHHANRRAKMQSLPSFYTWLSGPGRQALLISWREKAGVFIPRLEWFEPNSGG